MVKRTTEERMREFVHEALAADTAIEKGAAVYRADDVHRKDKINYLCFGE